MWEPTEAQQAEIKEWMKEIMMKVGNGYDEMNKKLESIIEDNRKLREKWKVPEDKSLSLIHI